MCRIEKWRISFCVKSALVMKVCLLLICGVLFKGASENSLNVKKMRGGLNFGGGCVSKLMKAKKKRTIID